jgi:hypothetical protein
MLTLALADNSARIIVSILSISMMAYSCAYSQNDVHFERDGVGIGRIRRVTNLILRY